MELDGLIHPVTLGEIRSRVDSLELSACGLPQYSGRLVSVHGEGIRSVSFVIGEGYQVAANDLLEVLCSDEVCSGNLAVVFEDDVGGFGRYASTVRCRDFMPIEE